jgi:hypothetical protein
VKLVAESFAWPFRGRRWSRWLVGAIFVLGAPILFIPLLGYAIAATRAAEHYPSLGPPEWSLSARLIFDGSWTTLALAIIAAPFVVAWNPLASVLPVSDATLAHAIAFFVLALPWGLLVLLLMPHSTAAFAATGQPHDLFDVAAALRAVRGDFATWNTAAAAMVTAWAVGLACAGLLCVGLVPGIFYAILVSAHAAAALHAKDPRPSAR